MDDLVFVKTIKNIIKHGNIKLIRIKRKSHHLASEPNYHTKNLFSEKLLSIEIRQSEAVMNKPVYLGQPVLDISKIAMYEFLYGFVKPKYIEKTKLYYMNTASFIVHIKTEGTQIDIANNVETGFDTSSYELDKPLPRKKK